MATPETIDFDALLAPISEENGVGEDLRLDSSPTSVYYQIKDHRNQARAAERQSLMTGEGEPADWTPLLQLIPDAIGSLSKDLELVTYLIEALIREHGFAGLRDGFRLARDLVDRFGDDIYPTPDEDGLETRLAPLTSLNGDGGDGTLIAPIRMTPITQAADGGPYSLSDYLQAKNLEKISSDARERQLAEGTPTVSTIEAAVAQTEIRFFQTLSDDLDEALAELKSLTDTLDARYGRDSPPTHTIESTLKEVQSTLRSLAGDRLDSQPETSDQESGGFDEAAGEARAGGAAVSVPAGTIQTRDDAFRQILRVAEFFRRTEPHTPISFALERIVRWGRMPLPELLRELIGDEGSVHEMFKLVGIPESGDEDREESSEDY